MTSVYIRPRFLIALDCQACLSFRYCHFTQSLFSSLRTLTMVNMQFFLSIGILFSATSIGAATAVVRPRDCAFTWAAENGDSCQSMATSWGVTQAQFISYNPGVVCNTLVTGQEYCVEWTGTPPSLPVTTKPTTTSTSATTTTTAPTGPVCANPSVIFPMPREFTLQTCPQSETHETLSQLRIPSYKAVLISCSLQPKMKSSVTVNDR